MSMKIRKLISHRIAELVKSDNQPYLLSNVPALLELRKTEKAPELHLPVIKTRNLLERNGATLIKQIVETKYDDRLIKDVSVVQETTKSSRAPTIIFKLNTDNFIKEALTEVQNIDHLCFGERRKIIVEYSSPNIAKPFHVGHLRSTIIGNFIANLYKFLGNNVVKMNYLGDWGTQFGMLQVGVEMTGITEEEIKQNPIQKLYEAYVSANRAAESNSEIAEKARQVFTQLEMHESSEIRKKWSRFRNYTIDELKCIYDRLGVHFDEYAWESQYSQKEIQNIIDLLSSKNLLLTENDGKKVVQVDDRKVPVIKSDGTTLYLARDIAAILDRFERYKFDKIFYVVDNAQTDHFHACFHIANKLEQNLQAKATHIKFGRIKGMSTRTGSAVFLKDVLDEARDIMLQKQLQSPTTKLDMKNFDSTTADVLGVSAVIVNDLKQRRQRDYEYVLERALQVNGDTGIKLQYTHCRLCSLLDKVQVAEIKGFDPNLLIEPEARDLILEITRFPESIFKARQEHEACALVNYLFSLSNVTSRALKRLNVKNEKSAEMQAQRMGLFNASRIILDTGMKILGLKPLEKM